jgi:hypothetical protein
VVGASEEGAAVVGASVDSVVATVVVTRAAHTEPTTSLRLISHFAVQKSLPEELQVCVGTVV